MRAEILRPCMVIDNFIDGTMEPYSYEDYLRDFVNHSDYFLQKSNGKPYSKPVSESNGEWDCISDGYSFDFKLFTSQSRLQAARIFSQSITLVAPGVVRRWYQNTMRTIKRSLVLFHMRCLGA